MIATQTTIEDALARRSDPETSHEAAQITKANKLAAEIYAVMLEFGDAGCIAEDVEKALPGTRSHSITPRFRAMISAGMIELTGDVRKASSGVPQQLRRALPKPWIPHPDIRPMQTTSTMRARIEELETDRDRILLALCELVACKDLRDKFLTGDWKIKAEYENRKPPAWAAARLAIALSIAAQRSKTP